MSTYVLTEVFQPVKEIVGTLRNVTQYNIAYAITDGRLPKTESEYILEPNQTYDFDLRNKNPLPPSPVCKLRDTRGYSPLCDADVDEVFGIYDTVEVGSTEADMKAFREKEGVWQTLFVRALKIDSANPTPTVVVDGSAENVTVLYDITGMTIWHENTHYDVNQFVSYNNRIYRCNEEHTSLATWDSSKWNEQNTCYKFQTKESIKGVAIYDTDDTTKVVGYKTTASYADYDRIMLITEPTEGNVVCKEYDSDMITTLLSMYGNKTSVMLNDTDIIKWTENEIYADSIVEIYGLKY